jgi:tRNA dimethylallyltransferase
MKMSTKKKVIVIVGATGSGKSALALKLAKKYNGYLISADSRQLFKKMDIGTNKDRGRWLNGKFLVDGIEECLVDFLAPNEVYSLAEWLNQAKNLIEKRKKLAIVVGGTGLYTTALTEGFTMPGKQDVKLREKFEAQLVKYGLKYLVKRLLKLDPNTKVDLKNPRRVIRALEINLTAEDVKAAKVKPDYEFLQIYVTRPREQLYERIDKRVDQMINEGLIDEVKKLIKQYSTTTPALSGIGYRQIIGYLSSEYDLVEAIRLIKRDTRRYAKRQITWYKKYPRIKLVKNHEEANRLVKSFLGGKKKK